MNAVTDVAVAGSTATCNKYLNKASRLLYVYNYVLDYPVNKDKSGKIPRDGSLTLYLY